MGETTTISWTDATWSPLRAWIRTDAHAIATAKGYTSLVKILEARKPNGELRSPPGKAGPHCEHASDGCLNCYSEKNGGRCLPTNGTGLPFDRRSRDLVEIAVDGKMRTKPLQWKRGRKIFVNSQTDTFGEFVTDEMIDQMLAVMALCPQHTFQILTKRAQRMKEYFAVSNTGRDWRERVTNISYGLSALWQCPTASIFPLPNVWLGISCEDQQRADERIPDLLATPAAVRFVSAEPLLGLVDLRNVKARGAGYIDALDGVGHDGTGEGRLLMGEFIDWVIVGGESGPGARPCDLAWVRSIRDQCAAAGVACFLKQLGARPFSGESLHLKIHKRTCDGRLYLKFKDRKGGEMSEWAEEFRVREMPEVSR